MRIKLLIADNHEVERAGLKTLIKGTDIKIVGEATSVEDVVRLTGRHSPHLVMMDVRLSNGDGLTALGRIKLDYPEIPVLMFSTYDSPAYIARAVALGASGYVLKSVGGKKLIGLIRRTASGDILWTQDQVRRVSRALAMPRMRGGEEVPLTHRESEVLKKLSSGMSNKEISMSLQISYETVKEHVQHILRKIGVVDRTQAAVWAIRQDLF